MNTSPLRFIGDPSDGQIIEVDDLSDKVSVSDQSMSDMGQVRAVPRTGRESREYTRRWIEVVDGGVAYFAPADWSDLQALQHLFGTFE